MQARAVVVPDGESVDEYEYDGAVANKALELLGKHVGMFIPPPRETFKQWEERRRRQVEGNAAVAKQPR